MADNFKELLKMAENERRQKAGLEPLPDEEPAETAETDSVATEEPISEKPRHLKKEKRTLPRFVKAILLLVMVVAICGGLAYFALIGAQDFSGINKSDAKVEVVIPRGASTVEIASILEENDLIDEPLIFRAYSKLSRRDGRYQAGIYQLSASMGYQKLAEIIIAGKPRETVTVTIPEGYTINQIAAKLEEKNVCTAAEFYDALLNETYDFDFFDSIPQASDGGKYEGRMYRLEGYLFPDTYDFFVGSSGKQVVQKFLSNFDSKITVAMKSAMQSQNLTLDDVVIMASIAQKESANTTEMSKVVRVLYNRLDSDYTRLECDSTVLYVKDLPSNAEGADKMAEVYNTYTRYGLTPGAICNPGLHAIMAAIYPSDDEYVSQCFYFANDTAGNTYYSKTFSQHVATCRKYKIGMYG